MKKFSFFLFLLLLSSVWGQSGVNCFLDDYEPRTIVLPPSVDAVKPTADATVTITTNTTDTIGRVSKYVFGNAIACWLGNLTDRQVLVNHLLKLAPTLIRYPGGSWSNIFFWNGINPGDLPDSIYDGWTYNNSTGKAKKVKFNYFFGANSWPTSLDAYYALRSDINTQGLITINYGYARYGLSADPVAKAAHLAADWVRYDDGRTLFWEIGNENGGPWEAGWAVDTAQNKDGQPMIVTGALYGKHFKVFADSMRAAAAELGNTIYIGGQVLHFDGSNSWNFVDKKWNEGFFQEVGSSPDFYVMHNYFGTNGATAKSYLEVGTTEPAKNISFIKQDIINKNAVSRPVAITEWNIQADDNRKSSFVNGMQSVVITCEMLKNQFGMSARWLVANWDKDGMFYQGNDAAIPHWNPRPDVFYMYYLQRFFGDHILNTQSSNSDVSAYASTFSSGGAGLVVVNKGTTEQITKINLNSPGVGSKYYVYSLTGGTDNGEFSQNVLINGVGPTAPAWGPIEQLETLPASAYTIDNEIKIKVPGRSVQFVMVEPGNNPLAVEQTDDVVRQFSLAQNYPNPFNPSTTIAFSLEHSAHVTLKVYDIIGREVATLINNEMKSAGTHEVVFDPAHLASGSYIYQIQADNFKTAKMMTFLK